MRLVSLLGLAIVTVVAVFMVFSMMVVSDLSKTTTQQQPKTTTQFSDESQAVLGSTDPEVQAEALYGFINAHRLEHGLSKLRVSPLLERSAELKLQTMVAEKYWRHENTQNEPPWQYLKIVGYNYINAGENLAFGSTSTWEVFTMWLESPSHNAELLFPDYREMGIAVDCDAYDAYATDSCLVVLHLGNT